MCRMVDRATNGERVGSARAGGEGRQREPLSRLLSSSKAPDAFYRQRGRNGLQRRTREPWKRRQRRDAARCLEGARRQAGGSGFAVVKRTSYAGSIVLAVGRRPTRRTQAKALQEPGGVRSLPLSVRRCERRTPPGDRTPSGARGRTWHSASRLRTVTASAASLNARRVGVGTRSSASSGPRRSTEHRSQSARDARWVENEHKPLRSATGSEPRHARPPSGREALDSRGGAVRSFSWRFLRPRLPFGSPRVPRVKGA